MGQWKCYILAFFASLFQCFFQKWRQLKNWMIDWNEMVDWWIAVLHDNMWYIGAYHAMEPEKCRQLVFGPAVMFPSQLIEVGTDEYNCDYCSYFILPKECQLYPPQRRQKADVSGCSVFSVKAVLLITYCMYPCIFLSLILNRSSRERRDSSVSKLSINHICMASHVIWPIVRQYWLKLSKARGKLQFEKLPQPWTTGEVEPQNQFRCLGLVSLQCSLFQQFSLWGEDASFQKSSLN